MVCKILLDIFLKYVTPYGYKQVDLALLKNEKIEIQRKARLCIGSKTGMKTQARARERVKEVHSFRGPHGSWTNVERGSCDFRYCSVHESVTPSQAADP